MTIIRGHIIELKPNNTPKPPISKKRVALLDLPIS